MLLKQANNKQFNHIIRRMFGTNMDLEEARKLSIKNLKLCKVTIDALVQSNDLVSIDNTKSDYVNVIKQALMNLEELQKYNESMKNMDVSILDDVINYTDDELSVKLTDFVNRYVNPSKLNLSSDSTKDRFSTLYQIERTLKHKDEISCIL